ncbi:hypothetical protein [Halobacillus litoralis]|uniref:Uncharacterized protein n=1 Tax=Halobacillus litoralis TaxID=45668 RepID=A0A410MC96_9BACI|nr:hypothetical protein [Halobacillus litoralis]QAS52351.1 hypothetical protein HLI_08965 [Halobacillus litoralis]
MTQGPRWTTNNFRTINGEDHLGILYVGISIADTLQSGITSITPRARYWSFFAWVLKDFIENVPDKKSVQNFKTYLKKQEWYYILANIAEAEEREGTINSVIGSTHGYKVWNSDQQGFSVDTKYVKDPFGGYGTYRNVMKIMGVTKAGDAKKGVNIDRLTPFGKELADAFELNVKDTTYYKTYRKQDINVPREVLVEYGKVAALASLDASSKDRKLLTNMFMPEQPKSPKGEWRRDSLLYYMILINHFNGQKVSIQDWQHHMYDSFYHNKINLQAGVNEVAIGWEIYQARQFFTYSLLNIWTYLLDKMSKRVFTKAELISAVLVELSEQGYDLQQTVKDLENDLSFPYDRRETFLKHMEEQEKSVKNHLWQPLLIMLDVNLRLQNRADFQDFHYELLRLGGRDSISFQSWTSLIEGHKTKPVSKFISYILNYYILDQHQKVALNKMITTNNETYHFTENNGKLYLIAEDTPVYNTFRVYQGLSILEDLGLITQKKRVYHVTPLGEVKLSG